MNNNIHEKRKTRRAVGSHVRWGSHNAQGLSAHVPHERFMSHSDRKRVMLPCGFTIAASWAALRKSWLGFNICLSKGDREGMKNYAFHVRKLQRQTGMGVTDFDSDILTAEEVDSIDQEYSVGDDYQKPQETEVPVEREVDYDSLFDGTAAAVEPPTMARDSPHPRNEIFAQYLSRPEKTCPQENRARIDKEVVNYKGSCPVGDIEANPTSSVIIKKVSYPNDRNCFIRYGNQTGKNTQDPTPAFSNTPLGFTRQASDTANVQGLVDDVNEHDQSENSSIGIQEKTGYDPAPKKTDSFESKHHTTYDELLGGNLPPIEEEDGAEGDTGFKEDGTDIDNNQDNNEPSEWAHVSDFQTTETTDPDHIVHEDNSCPYQVDDNQDDKEPSEWAHVSDFQTTETTDPDHVVHEDNSCPFQETVKRDRSCPYKYDDD
jgi:hypothetical protein